MLQYGNCIKQRIINVKVSDLCSNANLTYQFIPILYLCNILYQYKMHGKQIRNPISNKE